MDRDRRTFSLDDGAFCLDVTDGVDADGTKLQVWACTPGDTIKHLSTSSLSPKPLKPAADQDFAFTDVRDGTMIQWFGATSKVCGPEVLSLLTY